MAVVRDAQLQISINNASISVSRNGKRRCGKRVCEKSRRIESHIWNEVKLAILLLYIPHSSAAE